MNGLDLGHSHSGTPVPRAMVAKLDRNANGISNPIDEIMVYGFNHVDEINSAVNVGKYVMTSLEGVNAEKVCSRHREAELRQIRGLDKDWNVWAAALTKRVVIIGGTKEVIADTVQAFPHHVSDARPNGVGVLAHAHVDLHIFGGRDMMGKLSSKTMVQK